MKNNIKALFVFVFFVAQAVHADNGAVSVVAQANNAAFSVVAQAKQAIAAAQNVCVSKANSAACSLDAVIKNHPKMAVVVAFVAGYVIARVINTTEEEDEA